MLKVFGGCLALRLASRKETYLLHALQRVRGQVPPPAPDSSVFFRIQRSSLDAESFRGLSRLAARVS